MKRRTELPRMIWAITACFATVTICNAVLAQTSSMTAGTPLPETCALPEVMRAWQTDGGVRANSTSRDPAEAGARTQVRYGVVLKACSDTWCKPEGHSALLKVDIAQDGRYRISTDQMLWIDLYDTSQKLEGLLCEHSGCRPIRKIVQYDVKAGPHWVALEGKSAGNVNVLVTKVHQ